MTFVTVYFLSTFPSLFHYVLRPDLQSRVTNRLLHISSPGLWQTPCNLKARYQRYGWTRLLQNVPGDQTHRVARQKATIQIHNAARSYTGTITVLSRPRLRAFFYFNPLLISKCLFYCLLSFQNIYILTMYVTFAKFLLSVTVLHSGYETHKTTGFISNF